MGKPRFDIGQFAHKKKIMKKQVVEEHRQIQAASKEINRLKNHTQNLENQIMELKRKVLIINTMNCIVAYCLHST